MLRGNVSLINHETLVKDTDSRSLVKEYVKYIYYAGFMVTAIADTKPIMYVLLKDKKRQRLVLNHD